MKVGRNDPCPCGSGKKYKKCCLAADEAKAPAVVEPPHAEHEPAAMDMPKAPAPLPRRLPKPKPVDPRRAAIDRALEQRYEEFEAADLDGKVAMFLRLVDGEGDPPMDDEDALEMLNTLYSDLAKSGQRAPFNELVDALRQKQPKAYEGAQSVCLDWSIHNLAAMGRWDELAGPVKELAGRAGKDIEVLTRVMGMLDFHGQLHLLLEAARVAWPEVKESENILAWAVGELADRAMYYEIFDYLEQHPDASGEEEELLQRLRPYAGDELEWVAEYLANLRRPVPGPAPLDPADFDLNRRKLKRSRRDGDEDDAADPGTALVNLSVTFLGWMHRERNVALTRGEVGRDEVVQFLSQRAEGELDDNRSMAERMMDRRKPPKRPIEHPLCPDRIRFEACLVRMFNVMSMRARSAAMLMHVTPLWLEFLELNGLLTPDQRRIAVASLGGLVEPFRKLLSKSVDDPDLVNALDTWPV